MLIPSFNTAGSNAAVCVCVCLCACKRGKTHLAFIILLTSSSLSFSHRLSLRVLYPSVLPLPPPVPHLVAIRPTARTRLHISLKKQTCGKRRRRQQVVYKRRHKNCWSCWPVSPCGNSSTFGEEGVNAPSQRGTIGGFRSVSRNDWKVCFYKHFVINENMVSFLLPPVTSTSLTIRTPE